MSDKNYYEKAEKEKKNTKNTKRNLSTKNGAVILLEQLFGLRF